MKRFQIPLLILGLAAVAVAGFAATGGDAGPSFRTATVTRGNLVSAVTASAKLNAVVTVEVGSQLSGQVAELLADFNDIVSDRQPLARLDPQSFEAQARQAAADVEIARAALSEAEAQVAAAKAVADEADRDYDRKKLLANKGTISKSILEQVQSTRDSLAAALRAARAAHLMAKATIKARQAALEKALVELSRTVIRAPMDGVIIRRDVDLGQTVAASLQAPTLFTIAKDLRQMQAEADVNEADIGRIRPKQRVEFTVYAYPERTFVGQVVQIRKAPQEFDNVVTYAVIISADNNDLALLPGMTATARIVIAEKAGVLKVPNAALRFRPPGTGHVTVPSGAGDGRPATVWILGEDNSPKALGIRIGTTDNSAAEVLSGDLHEGQEVIVAAVLTQKKPWVFGLRWGF